MAKQDKSKFQLNKGNDHGFDISKGGKRKFDLSKDDDEPIVASSAKLQMTNPVAPSSSNPKPEKKNNKWLWIILVIIAIILLIWLLLPGKGTEFGPVVEGETIEDVTTSTEDTEEVSDDQAVPAEDVVADENVNNDDASTPSASDATTPESTPVAPQASNNVNNGNVAVSNDIEAEALKVIRGDYGIGQERKNKLGNQYEAIQRRVNELKKEGAF